MTTQAFLERVPMLSVHPDAAARDDVALLAAHLMESRRLLCLVWNHIQSNREGCRLNWDKLSNQIGLYLDNQTNPLTHT